MICQLCRRLAGSDLGVQFETEEQKLSHIQSHLRQLWVVFGHIVTVQDLFHACFSEKMKRKKTRTGAVEGRTRKIETDGVQARLGKLCRSLCEKKVSNNRIFCSECHRQICCRNSRQSLQVPILIDHARVHLDKLLFECSICAYTGATKTAVRLHVASTHGLRPAGSFKDLMPNYVDDFIASLHKCFGESDHRARFRSERQGKSVMNTSAKANRVRSEKRGTPGRQERSFLCYQLIQRFMKPGTGTVQCRQCLANIVVSEKTIVDISKAFKHVHAHLKLPIYSCRLCQLACHSFSVLSLHLTKAHGLMVTGNYNDRSDEFKTDILAMITDCFDWSKETSLPAETVGTCFSTIAKGNVSRRVARRRLAGREGDKLLCYQLIQRFTKPETGKIQCRRCLADIIALGQPTSRPYSSRVVMSHVHAHLKAPIYYYPLCQRSYRSFDSLGSRVTNAHSLKLAGNYIDRSEEFKTEILAMIRDCFDWSMETPGM